MVSRVAAVLALAAGLSSCGFHRSPLNTESANCSIATQHVRASADLAAKVRGAPAPSDVEVSAVVTPRHTVACLAAAGSPPYVNVGFSVNGSYISGVQYDSCSWPNAGRTLFLYTLPGDPSRAFGNLPDGAIGGRVETGAGRTIAVTSLPAMPRLPIPYFIVEWSGPDPIWATLTGEGRSSSVVRFTGAASVAVCEHLHALSTGH